MSINQIILEYLRIVISWPLLIFILGAIFLFKFSNSIKTLLENLHILKAGPFEFSQQSKKKRQGKKIEGIKKDEIASIKEESDELKKNVEIISREKQKITKESKQKERVIKELLKTMNKFVTILTRSTNAIVSLAKRAELYEFAYLNLYLVYNSKLALLWFYKVSFTKENFINSFPLPPQIINQTAEKEAIFNALLANGLIEQDGILFRITEKGKRFLKYLGYNIKI